MLTACCQSSQTSSSPSATRQLFFLRASGLWTASPPLLSLLTRYCGSPLDAFTLRPAASVSDVIFFSTLPSAVLPWLCQVTSSPLRSFFSAMDQAYPPRASPKPRGG